MPKQSLPAHLQNAPRATPNADRLAELKTMAATVRDLQAEKADLEQRLKDTNKSLDDYYYTKLPELMDAAGVPSIVIEAEGNHPRFEATVKPYYKASISAEWPPEQRKAAYDWLDANGHGSLIKTVVAVQFGREDRPKALALQAALQERGHEPVIEEAVHHATLTSWLKTQAENQEELPPLDLIGGRIGRECKPKKKEA